MKSLFGLSPFFLLLFLPTPQATSSTVQSPLFTRIDDLLLAQARERESSSFRPNDLDPLPMNSALQLQQNAGATPAATPSSGVFPSDFSVTTPDEDPNPLGNVEAKTQALADNSAQENPQEDRLANGDTEAQPPPEVTPSAAPLPTPDFGLNPDLNPALVAYQDAAENPNLVHEITQPAPAAKRVETVNEIYDDNVMFGEDQEEPRSKWRVGYTVIACIVIMAVLILVVYLRNVFTKYFNAVLLRRLSNVAKDVILILIVVTFLLWLKFLGVQIWQLPLNGICLGLSVFGLAWLFWGIYLIIYAQAHSVNWEEKEIQGKFRDRMLKDYRDLFDRLQRGSTVTNQERKAFHQYQSQLKYSLLRQNFIFPSYLPIVTENFLRDDFNFAGYLALCFDKVFGNLFRMSLGSLASIIGIVIFWLCVIQIEDARIEAVVFALTTPIISMILLFILKNKFSKIDTALRTPFTNPTNIDFIKNDAQKDAWANLQNPIPPYLSSAQDLFQHPPKIFRGQKKPNLQERLFWQSSPGYSLSMLHALGICQVLWASIFYGYYLPDYDAVFNIVLTTVASVVFIVNMFYLVPSSVMTYNIITNIEMKRDRDIISKVVDDQRALLRQALIKLYRLLKSARREFAEELGPGVRLREFTIKMIKESFRNITEDDSWEIEIQDLPRLVHLCGSRLDKDELVYLARGASEDLQTIFIDDFIETIEVMAKDVRLDPYETSNEVLRSLAVKDDDFFVLKEFKELLVNHKVLSKSDIEEILHELRFTSANGLEVEIPNISSLIRNSIEESSR